MSRRKKAQPSFKNNQRLEQEVRVATRRVLVEDAWNQLGSRLKKKDPELDAVLQWLGSRKKANLRTLLGECIMSEEGWMVWRNCQNFISLQDTLYLHSTPKGEDEDLLLFVVPKAYSDWTATINGCHWDAGHQGHDRTALSVARMYLVARNGQTNETSHQDL